MPSAKHDLRDSLSHCDFMSTATSIHNVLETVILTAVGQANCNLICHINNCWPTQCDRNCHTYNCWHTQCDRNCLTYNCWHTQRDRNCHTYNCWPTQCDRNCHTYSCWPTQLYWWIVIRIYKKGLYLTLCLLLLLSLHMFGSPCLASKKH